jgi:hypothetical protein
MSLKFENRPLGVIVPMELRQWEEQFIGTLRAGIIARIKSSRAIFAAPRAARPELFRTQK